MNSFRLKKNRFALLTIILAGLIFSWLLTHSDIAIEYTVTYGILLGSTLLVIFIHDKRTLLILLLAWLPVQNFILMLIYHYLSVPNLFIKILLVTKELLIILLLTYILLSGNYNRRSLIFPDKMAFLFFCIATLYFLIPKSIMHTQLNLYVRSIAYRTVLLPVFLYAVGRFVLINGKWLKRLLTFLLIITIGITTFGYLEYSFPLSFWTQLGFFEYQEAIKGVNVKSFKGAALVSSSGMGELRRLKSFFLHPNGFAYYILFIIILWIARYLQDTNMSLLYFLIPLGFVCLAQILSLGRGALLGTLIGAGALLLYSKRWLLGFVLMGSLILIVTFGPAMLEQVAVATINLEESSARAHIAAFHQGIAVSLRYPLGLGLGHGGYWGAKLSEASIVVGENMYLSLLAQVGVLGLITFIIFITSVTTMCLRNVKSLRSRSARILVTAIGSSMIGYAFSSITSEPLLRFTTTGTFWIFTGIAVQLANRRTS